ncbi:MAG: polysaccharide deacetylase family protein [Deltaproteobacteria bacterium]|nr:polysaccharide deacetylase family protein [Deltaproteobacteria bacterium]
MSADDLSGLPRELIEIGSHTVTHPNLTALSPSEARRELIDSRRALQGILDDSVETFSVPFGECSDETLRLAREAGYTTILTCEPEVVWPSREPLGIGRFEVSADDWMLEFKLKAAGAYRWRRHVRWLKRSCTAVVRRLCAGGPRKAGRRVEDTVNDR